MLTILERHKIKEPWNYETQNPVSDPPDINYRPILANDQEDLDLLLQDGSIHFTERCLQYQKLDARMEFMILDSYQNWTDHMEGDAAQIEDEGRRKFFDELYEAVSEDLEEVQSEWGAHNDAERKRHRREKALEIGLGGKEEEWTVEDKRRLLNHSRGFPIDYCWGGALGTSQAEDSDGSLIEEGIIQRFRSSTESDSAGRCIRPEVKAASDQDEGHLPAINCEDLDRMQQDTYHRPLAFFFFGILLSNI